MAAAVAGPTGSPSWRKGPRSARGPVPDRPRSPRCPPTRPRTCHCYRDTLFWRFFFSTSRLEIIGIKRITLEESPSELAPHIAAARLHVDALSPVSRRSSPHALRVVIELRLNYRFESSCCFEIIPLTHSCVFSREYLYACVHHQVNYTL